MARTIFTTIIIAALAPLAAFAGSPEAELIDAARANDAVRVQALLEEGVDADARDENGATALMFVAAYGYADLARILVERGADVNTSGPIGNTALHYAAQEGHAEVARILVDSGADIHAQSESGGTPMAFAVGWGYRDIVEILREKEAPPKPVFAGMVPLGGAILIGLLAAVAIPVLGTMAISAAAQTPDSQPVK